MNRDLLGPESGRRGCPGRGPGELPLYHAVLVPAVPRPPRRRTRLPWLVFTNNLYRQQRNRREILPV